MPMLGWLVGLLFRLLGLFEREGSYLFRDWRGEWVGEGVEEGVIRGPNVTTEEEHGE